MQKRAVRWTLLALLLTSGAGAAVFAWTTHGRLEAAHKAEVDRLLRIDQLQSWLIEISTTQHAYVAPGQPLQPALDRVATLLPRVRAEVDDLAAEMQAPAARATVERLGASVRTIADADSSAREQLESGQFLWTAEIVFGPAREAHTDAVTTLRELRDAGRNAVASERDAARRLIGIALGAVAALWTLGLVALVPVASRPAAVVEQPEPIPAAEPAPVRVEGPPEAAAAPIAAPTPVPAPSTASIDLPAAAAICTDISRVASGEAVGSLLGRIASTLDAPGVVVWMGAGEELFAAAAAGYDARLLSRMGAISRSADNAVATAWRTCELRVVNGDGAANGAIVAPMFGPDTCIGVLAIETPPHREADADARALTELFAAQLATTLAAWPAPSVSPATADDFRMSKASGA